MKIVIYSLLCFLVFIGTISCGKEYAPDIPVRIFEPALGSNGILFSEGELWVADLLGSQLIRVNPIKGKITEQLSLRSVNAGPDDLVLQEDGTIVWTAPLQGLVGKTSAAGVSTILAEVDEWVNPIAFAPGKTAVLVGFSVGNTTELLKVDISDGTTAVVAAGLPPINGFEIAEDGFLYAPVFDLDAISGKGKIVKVDLSDGSFSLLTLTFPFQPAKQGLNIPTGVTAGTDGYLYALESFPPAVYKIEISSGEATLLAKIPEPLGDNLTVAPGGIVYATTFLGDKIAEIQPSGELRMISIKR